MYNVFYSFFRSSSMISIALILFLKLCLAQDYPPYLVSQDNEYSRATKPQTDKSNLYDWKNNFDNNVIIPDAYVFNLNICYN